MTRPRAGLPAGASATVAASPLSTDPVWNVSAVVRLNTLGDSRYLYSITVTSGGDSHVLWSHFPLEKWHHHLCFHTTTILLYVFHSVAVVLGRAVPGNSITPGYLKKKKKSVS